MTTNEDLMRVLGQLEEGQRSTNEKLADLTGYVRGKAATQDRRIGSLETSRTVLWTALVTGKALILAGLAYIGSGKWNG